ncbi:response regulator transcription factor [Paucibacter sp. R3-3]|uniref:Response regulator transcription factor n=1 Tax=Roseateles agri TaxID=3098619 RepID=A0ABU5DJB5_9BURK|nr:response regulator transcription factor [Paucibacter sp. R3-3]MDY0746381.1 response regulator transcription factor [Paucibacter sp. R3-3]
MQMTSPMRVLVAHAEPMVHLGLVATLARDERFELDEQCADHLDLNLLARGGGPTRVLVADLMTGIAAARAVREGRISRLAAPTAVLVVSAAEGELVIRGALEAGVLGYLTYEACAAQLLDAVALLARGQRFLAPSVALRLAGAVAQDLPTRREIDVLKLVATGLCNKAIAAELDIAAGTVKAHVKALLQKLDAPTRTAAADIAKRRGLLDPVGEQLAFEIARPRPTARRGSAMAA